jgi:hypothetical protein
MDFDQIMQTVTTMAIAFGLRVPVTEQHLVVQNSDAHAANA